VGVRHQHRVYQCWTTDTRSACLQEHQTAGVGHETLLGAGSTLSVGYQTLVGHGSSTGVGHQTLYTGGSTSVGYQTPGQLVVFNIRCLFDIRCWVYKTLCLPIVDIVRHCVHWC
jgi:hypothetical protein